jgi:hypothetical protein
VNSAASLAAGLPVGRPSTRCLVLTAYALPAVAAWLLLGAILAATPLTWTGLTWIGLIGAVGYGAYYGLTELTGVRGLMAPGRRWQVPQTMMIDASPRRRVLVWGAILGPGFVTRNPYAGFGMLPLALAATRLAGPWAVLALAAVIGLAHGVARATALLRDVSDLHAGPPASGAAASGAAASGAAAQLDLLLKTVYARRLDGAVLLAVALAAAALAVASLLAGPVT